MSDLNIGVGRTQVRRVTQGRSVDPGLATPEGGGLDVVYGRKEVPMLEYYENGELVRRPHGSREVVPVVEDAAINEFFASPTSAAEVERKYSLRRGYLGAALRRRYGDVTTLKKALQGSLLESALVMAEHAMLGVEEMSARDAIMGAKIATDAAVGLEASIREAPRTIDFGSLAELGEGLARLQAYVTGDGGAPSDGGLSITSEETEITRE